MGVYLRQNEAIGEKFGMRRLCALVTFSLLLSHCILASAQVLSVVVRAGTSNESAGFVVNRSGDCVVLTAAHAVADRINVTVEYGTERLEASAIWNGMLSNQAIDLSILKTHNELKANCRALPDASTLEQALMHSVGQMWLRAQGDNIDTPRVSIIRRDSRFITLAVLDDPDRYAVAGVSGAAVTFNGHVAAVVVANQGKNLIAQRLDAVLREGASGLGAPPPSSATPAPFDLTLVAPLYATQAQNARKVRADAERVAGLARDVENLADEAAKFARTLPLNEAVRGHARYPTETGDFYEGQVKTVSGWFTSGYSMSASGFGVERILAGSARGRTLKCAFEPNRGCKGPSVYEWTDPQGWKRLEVENVDFRVNGPAKGVGHNGVTCFGSVRNNLSDDGGWYFSEHAVNIQPDGRIYEGQVDTVCNLHGYGVMWEKSGRLVRAGQWRQGKPVED